MEYHSVLEAKIHFRIKEINAQMLDNAESEELIELSIDKHICHFKFQKQIGGAEQTYVHIEDVEAFLNGLIIGLRINNF